MLGSLIESTIQKFEKTYNYKADYLRDLYHHSFGLLQKFNKFVKLSQFRRESSSDLFFVAKVAALKVADCGPCLQLNVDFAKEQGVSLETLQAAVQNPTQLPQDLKLVYDFANAIVANLDTASSLSEKIESKFGRKILAELAMSAATAPVYPVLKRGLRHAQACQLVKVKI